VHYGTYGTACLDTATGCRIWARRDLNCDHDANAGPASSPTLVGDTVVVHVDGRDVQYIIALDKEPGDTVLKRHGPVISPTSPSTNERPIRYRWLLRVAKALS
jgi:outer membrane protein assembly factor BamB